MNQPAPVERVHWWEDTPLAHKVGLILGLVAIFVSVSSSQVVRQNGQVTSCTYFDIVKVAAAVILVLSAIGGFYQNSKRTKHRLPTVASAAIALVMIVLAAYLGLVGFGVMFSPCQAA